MRRISTATRVVSKFGAGKDGFTNGDAVGGIPATDLEDVWFDHVQEEMASVIEAAGMTLDPNDRTQLLAALQIQSAPIVGLARNVRMSVLAASPTATLTADQIVVATALGGRHFRLSAFSKTINLATTGAGGMDTGSAPTSGFVGIYAIYNPATGTSALLGVNATSAVVPEVYGGANMPAGFTASALVSVWKTSGAGQFSVGRQRGRRISIPASTVLSTNAAVGTPTAFSIAGTVPQNAMWCAGRSQIGTTLSTGSQGITLWSDAGAVGAREVSMNFNSGTINVITTPWEIDIFVLQMLYYSMFVVSGTGAVIQITQYEI